MSVEPGDTPSTSESNNPTIRTSQNKSQLLEAMVRNVPKLKELNYTQWKSLMTNSIKKAKLWGYVDGSIEEPAENDASILTTYYDEAAAVRNAILGSLDSGAQSYIEEPLDPRDAWNVLEKTIEKQLAGLRLEEEGDMIEHIAEFCRFRSHLSGTRFALGEQASISIQYRSLPASYRQSAVTSEGAEMKDFRSLCVRLSYLSQNPQPPALINDTPTEDYTNWGIPGDTKAFGLTGAKNPLLKERTAVTCRDCLLKSHEAGTPECPQYEWRRELWGDLRESEITSTEGKEIPLILQGRKRFIYEFSELVKVTLSFQELKLKEHLLQSLNRCELRSPHGLQQCAVLPVINVCNVVAQAPAEIGKTLAMILSVLQLTDTTKGEIQALIISPTEQQVTQVHSVITSLGYECYKSTTSQSVEDSLGQLSRGHSFSILVGTPDRVLNLSRQCILSTSKIKILALDDLDTIVDDVLGQVLNLYQYLPRAVQTLVIGFDLPNKIPQQLISYIDMPLYVTIGCHDRVVAGITHAILIVPCGDSSS